MRETQTDGQKNIRRQMDADADVKADVDADAKGL